MKTVKPMLPASIDSSVLNKITFPKYGSVKLDGIRCLIVNGTGQSRSGKGIRNRYIQHCLAPLAGRGFDGEIIVYDDNGKVLPFNGVTSAVMSADGRPNFTYNVFDLWDSERSYENRYRDLTLQYEYVRKKCSHIVLHPHRTLRSMEDLLNFEREALENGQEGIILREPVSWYKNGRSTLNGQGMLKLKRTLDEDGFPIDYADAEGVVIGFDEYMITEDLGKYIDEFGDAKSSCAEEFKIPGDMLGKLYVRMLDGTELAVGSGFTLDQRKRFWEERASLLNKLVKFKYMKHGSVKKPRHPVFLGFRDPLDMDFPLGQE